MKVTLSNESDNPDIIFNYFYFDNQSDEDRVMDRIYQDYLNLENEIAYPDSRLCSDDLESHPYRRIDAGIGYGLATYLLEQDSFMDVDDSDWLFSLKVEDGKPNLILHIEGAHGYDFCCIEVDQTFEHMENCREALEACDDDVLERLAVFGGKAAEEWSSRQN